MPITVPQGLRVGGKDPVDDRIIFDTTAAALASITAPRRYDGLAVWIKSEAKTYRFLGGIANSDFVPEPSSGGGSNLTAPVNVTEEVGGLNTGDVLAAGTDITTVLQKILDPAKAPEITAFTAVPEFGLKEVGTAVSSAVLSADVVKRTSAIQSVKIIQLPDVGIFEETQLPDGGTVTHTDSTGVDTGIRTYQITAIDTNNLTTAATGSYEFVYPAFTGSVSTTAPLEFDIVSLTKHIMKPSTIQHKYTTVNQRFCAAFPASWGLPTAINDQNSLRINSMFTQSTLPVTFGSYTETYNVLVYKYANTLTDYQVTFVFD